MQTYVKIKSSRNDEINLSFIDIGKSCPSCEFLTSQICDVFQTLFAKIKFSQKITNLQYLAKEIVYSSYVTCCSIDFHLTHHVLAVCFKSILLILISCLWVCLMSHQQLRSYGDRATGPRLKASSDRLE